MSPPRLSRRGHFARWVGGAEEAECVTRPGIGGSGDRVNRAARPRPRPRLAEEGTRGDSPVAPVHRGRIPRGSVCLARVLVVGYQPSRGGSERPRKPQFPFCIMQISSPLPAATELPLPGGSAPQGSGVATPSEDRTRGSRQGAGPLHRASGGLVTCSLCTPEPVGCREEGDRVPDLSRRDPLALWSQDPWGTVKPPTRTTT